MKKRVTQANLLAVMVNLTSYARDTLAEPTACKLFCLDLDKFLDDLADQDAFGTEGQCDPRGDQRN